MKAYLLRRLLLIIPSFLGISLITFAMLQLMPGNPVMLRLQKLQGTMGAGSISAVAHALPGKLGAAAARRQQ